MHPWQDLKFRRTGRKKGIVPLFSFFTPCIQGLSATTPKELFVSVYDFQKYRAEEEKPGCALMVGLTNIPLGNICLSKRCRWSEYLNSPKLLFQDLSALSLTGCSPTLSLIILKIFHGTSKICGESSADTQLFSAHAETALQHTLSDCAIC